MMVRLENVTVRVATAAAAVSFLIGAFVADTAWRVNVVRDIRDLRGMMTRLDRRLDPDTSDLWTDSMMRDWVVRTERVNVMWRGAEIDDVRRPGDRR